MTDHETLEVNNINGEKTVEITSKNFMCSGSDAPFDHSHVFLNMGEETEKRCPYCRTRYVLKI